MSSRVHICSLIAATSLATLAIASGANANGLDTSGLPAPGSVSETTGLEAWDRIFEVFTHPRCINCHVGADNAPLWRTELSRDDVAHGMAINADASRIGARTVLCSACHQLSAKPNTVPRAAPHTGMVWRLAPLGFQWVDKDSREICLQVRDPERNGGRDAQGLIEHILHDASVVGFIAWSYDPGPGRAPAPGSLQSHLEDMATWTAAGMPCPAE